MDVVHCRVDFHCCLLQTWPNLLNIWSSAVNKWSSRRQTFNRAIVASVWFMKIQMLRLHQRETLQHLLIWGSITATSAPPPDLSHPTELYCHSLPVQPKQTRERERERERRPASFRTWPVRQMSPRTCMRCLATAALVSIFCYNVEIWTKVTVSYYVTKPSDNCFFCIEPHSA
jgi:hypothetical protein